jgi:intracellular sulfur oxidation DsrE/DsrF family protein
MKPNETNKPTNRRNFIGKLTTGAAAIGLTTIAPSLNAFAGEATSAPAVYGDPEEMFKKINGKHKVVFDATQPHEIYPFAWPRVFLMTNEMTGTQSKDCSVVVVLRHTAIGYAMEDRLWAKYNLGEIFKANDPETGKPSLRNPFWKPKPGAFKAPGIGEILIGIDQLQANGVMFCVCEAAMTVYSAVVAGAMKSDAAEVRKDFVSGLLPGIQPVPSGVWALGRAQEKGCGYIFAG